MAAGILARYPQGTPVYILGDGGSSSSGGGSSSGSGGGSRGGAASGGVSGGGGGSGGNGASERQRVATATIFSAEPTADIPEGQQVGLGRAAVQDIALLVSEAAAKKIAVGSIAFPRRVGGGRAKKPTLFNALNHVACVNLSDLQPRSSGNGFVFLWAV